MPSTFLSNDLIQAFRGRLSLRTDLLLLCCVGLLFLLLFHQTASSARFQYDEADYMTAARMGFLENYLERSSMSLPAFLEIGLQALSKKIDRTELSEYIRHHDDVSFYRHFHGSLYFHWLTLMARVSTHESWLRATGLTFHLLTFGTIFAGVLALFGSEARPAAWVASLLYLFSVTNIRTSLIISAHPMYVWVAVLTLFIIARFLVTGRSEHLLFSIACATVGLCVLEFGVLLFVTLAAVMLLLRRQLQARNPSLHLGPALWKGTLLFLSLCALLWPAGLFKLSMLKAYLAMPYLMFFRRDSFGMADFVELWSQRLSQSPLEYLILILCSLAAVIALRSPILRTVLLPFALYVGFILMLTAKSDTDRYMASAFPALYVMAGVALANWARPMPQAARATIFATASLALLLNATHQVPPPVAEARTEDRDTVDFVRSNFHRLHAVLVPAPWVPTIQYYVPELIVRSYPADVEGDAEYIRRRIVRTSVDALFLCWTARNRLTLDRDLQGQAERVIGPTSGDPACGPFVVYFFTRPHAASATLP